MNMFKVCFMAIALVGAASAAPQFGGPSDVEEHFNDNPQYSYRYQVADDNAQTYISQSEARDGDNVEGSYSYVDANGGLVTVTYQAGAMGYTEERDVQDNFLVIRAKPASSSTFGTTTVQNVVNQQTFSTETTSSVDDGDLVARILAQLTPFIQQTVSSSLSGGNQQSTRTTTTRRVSAAPQQVTRRVVQSAPVVTRTASSSAVEGIFGVQGANNVQFETPEFNYAFDLQ